MKIDIRETEFEDVDFILEIENNRHIWKVSHTKKEYKREEIEYFVANNMIEGLNNGQKRWIITSNSVAVGCIDLFEYDNKNHRAGIGIIIKEEYQNNGIASVALKQFIEFAKTDIKLHQLYCSIFADNNFSIRLFSKLGFIETGIRKDWTFYKNKYYDEIFYQLIF